MINATRPASRYASWLADAVQSAADRAVSNPASLGVGADLIGFGGGQPASESYPLEALQRAYSRAILEDGRDVLPYGPTAGLPALREIVAERLGQRGINADPQNVVILTGSLQGLHPGGAITLPLRVGAPATSLPDSPRGRARHGRRCPRTRPAERPAQAALHLLAADLPESI